MHTMSELVHLLDAEKNLIAFLTKNCNKFNSDVKLQLEQETSAPFFAAIYYYFNSILLLVATSAV